MLYTLYGLTIRSTLPIAGLALAAHPLSGPEIEVRFSQEPPASAGRFEAAPYYASSSSSGCGEPDYTVWQSPGRDWFRVVTLSGLDFVWHRSGAKIWVNWSKTAGFDEAVFCLLGLVMGFVLRCLGLLCFHASAVNVNGRAVAFVGGSGAGKSTTAAALARLGRTVLSEELVVVKPGQHGFVAHPGYARVRLTPASVAALYGSADRLPSLVAGWDKRCLDLIADEDRFQREPLPLRAIYCLGDRREDITVPVIRPLFGAEAFMGLVANTYANCLLDSEMRAEEFRALTNLAARVCVRSLTTPANLARIREIGEFILADAEDLTS